MAFADPQSVTIGSAISLARTSFGTNSGIFTSADGLTKLSVSHSYGARYRRLVRLDSSKIAADPLLAGVNVKAGMSAYLVIDVPQTGFDAAGQLAVVGGLSTWLTASSSAKTVQLLAGEV